MADEFTLSKVWGEHEKILEEWLLHPFTIPGTPMSSVKDAAAYKSYSPESEKPFLIMRTTYKQFVDLIPFFEREEDAPYVIVWLEDGSWITFFWSREGDCCRVPEGLTYVHHKCPPLP